MKLKELIKLKLVRDNVRVLVFKKDGNGLGDFTDTYDANRIFARPVSKDDLLKAGVTEEMFEYNVTELWGYKPNKMGIVIEKPEPDHIEITCYGRTKIYDSRDVAIKYFAEALGCCDPNSHESARYIHILACLRAGHNKITDEDV